MAGLAGRVGLDLHCVYRGICDTDMIRTGVC